MPWADVLQTLLGNRDDPPQRLRAAAYLSSASTRPSAIVRTGLRFSRSARRGVPQCTTPTVKVFERVDGEKHAAGPRQQHRAAAAR